MAVARPMPLPAPVTDTRVSPKAPRGRPTCARNKARLGWLPSYQSAMSCTAAAITCGCDIGEKCPARMSRRHSRGTQRAVTSYP